MHTHSAMLGGEKFRRAKLYQFPETPTGATTGIYSLFSSQYMHIVIISWSMEER